MQASPCPAAKPLDARVICIAVVLLALMGLGSPAAARTAEDRLAVTSANFAYASFGSMELAVDASAIGSKASNLFDRTGNEREAYSNCHRADAACPPKVHRWRAALERLDGRSGLDLLTAVNTLVNGLIAYRDDMAAYGKADHWATPMESLTGYGDCEDYASLKQLSLSELGISPEQMRIVVLRDNARDIGHAVLAVTLDERTYILDNVIARPTLDTALPHYQPIYSFNETRQWLNVAYRTRGTGTVASNTNPAPVAAIAPAAKD